MKAVDEGGTVGLVDVKQDTQDFVVGRVARHLRGIGHDLKRPDFRKLAPSET